MWGSIDPHLPIGEKLLMVAEEPTHSHDLDDEDEDRQVVVPLTARRDDDSRASSHTAASLSDPDDGDPLPWPARARRVSRFSRLLALSIPLCWLIGWPIGSILASEQVTGVWSFRLGYSLDVILWAVTAGIAIRLIGYVLSLALRLEASAQQLVSGQGPRRGMSELGPGSISALNDEIDHALERLAEAESLIRQQVRAIGNAGEALGAGTARSAERLEQEREALIALTEEMNLEAERFAQKIAERSQVAADEQAGLESRLLEREQALDTRIDRFENASTDSLDRFEELALAMEKRSAALRDASTEATEHQTTLTSRLEENTARIQAAHQELANQSSKLEELMRDQRRRADRLAKVLTEQANRAVPGPKPVHTPAFSPAAQQTNVLKKPSPPTAEDKQSQSWKDIFAKVEEANPTPLQRPAKPEADAPAPSPTPVAETPARITPVVPPANPASAPSAAQSSTNMEVLDRLIVRIQNYSLVLQTQLFGGPSHEDLDRFESGERQIFARALIARDPDTLRARIQAELSQNAVFRERTSEFLRDFDTILEPLSSEAGGADTIQTYLTSPLGRLYMLTGSAIGHFD